MAENAEIEENIEQPEEEKPSGLIKANPYVGKDSDIESQEAELQLLKDERDAALEAAKDDGEEVPENDPEPEDEQEKVYSKRYGDLRRHHQKTIQEKDDAIVVLERQVAEAAEGNLNIPTDPAELDKWQEEYPQVAAAIHAIAAKTSKEEDEKLRARLETLEEKEHENEVTNARIQLERMHPDLEQIEDDPAFHEWVQTQPKSVSDVIYNDALNYSLIGYHISQYKAAVELAELKQGTSKRKQKKTDADARSAAASTSVKGSPKPANEKKKAKVWTETEVAKMSASEYEKNRDEIMLAQQEGRFQVGA